MTKVYIYKLTVDDGGAPCVSDGILSLAICKPAIRSTAKLGNIIFGFAANSLYSDNCLVYMARVTENLGGRKYFSDSSRYADRPDCIYRWDGHRFEWETDSKFHSRSDLDHDLGEGPSYSRANVILSETPEDFKYFGANCPIDYKRDCPHLKSLVEEMGQGHRVNFDPAVRDELQRFIQRLWGVPSAYRDTAVPDTPCRDKCDKADEDCVTVVC